MTRDRLGRKRTAEKFGEDRTLRKRLQTVPDTRLEATALDNHTNLTVTTVEFGPSGSDPTRNGTESKILSCT